MAIERKNTAGECIPSDVPCQAIIKGDLRLELITGSGTNAVLATATGSLVDNFNTHLRTVHNEGYASLSFKNVGDMELDLKSGVAKVIIYNSTVISQLRF